MNDKLIRAAEEGRAGDVRALIGKGADVNAQDSIRDSPFLLAGARGFTEIVRLALARKPDFAVTNRYGGTALIPACHYGHVETVQALLGSRIPIDHVNNLGWTALLEAIILGDGGPAHTEIVRLLVAHGADVNLADRAGTTPLAHARKRGYREIASTLERAGAR